MSINIDDDFLLTQLETIPNLSFEDILSDLGYSSSDEPFDEQEEEEDVENINEQLLRKNVSCVICLNKIKCVLYLPCKHLCTCKTCFRKLKRKKCPLCNTTFNESIFVYAYN